MTRIDRARWPARRWWKFTLAAYRLEWALRLFGATNALWLCAPIEGGAVAILAAYHPSDLAGRELSSDSALAQARDMLADPEARVSPALRALLGRSDAAGEAA